MDVFKNICVILVSAILVDNYVLCQFLGICPFLGVSKKTSSALGMSGAVTVVMTLAGLVTWPIYKYILAPFDLGYLSTMAFILIIAMLVQIVEILLKRFITSLYNALGVYLPLITTNCAVLGVTLLNIEKYEHFYEAVLNSFAAGVGFSLALILFSGIREKIESSDIPKAFRGMPIALIAASITALSFAGFAGLFGI
ncbi:MAG: RnfABCDGE type electron transport complex subunit A [Clostridiales bacterium]|nr:RnfABCDGE type electron transport complex subunit A [Clostridiales bacterium]